jgi:hypothetical protein
MLPIGGEKQVRGRGTLLAAARLALEREAGVTARSVALRQVSFESSMV